MRTPLHGKLDAETGEYTMIGSKAGVVDSVSVEYDNDFILMAGLREIVIRESGISVRAR
jgi:hypothetical protein